MGQPYLAVQTLQLGKEWQDIGPDNEFDNSVCMWYHLHRKLLIRFQGRDSLIFLTRNFKLAKNSELG